MKNNPWGLGAPSPIRVARHYSKVQLGERTSCVFWCVRAVESKMKFLPSVIRGHPVN